MFFHLFKKKKSDIPIEVRLNQLKEIGINLNTGITIKDLFQVVDQEEIENDPDLYLYLLIALGSEIEVSDDKWLSLSDDIWYIDTECIEDQGIYVQILDRLITMSRGYLRLEHITDNVDIEKEEAYLSFDYKGRSYRWELEVDDDWFDMKVIKELNKLLLEDNSVKRFAVAVIDQSCMITFFDTEQLSKLRKLTGIKFDYF